MIKKTITFTDFNGLERTEDFYFHLSVTEIGELNLTEPGGYFDYLQRAVNKLDMKALWEGLKTLVTKAYGVKSGDGRNFRKSPEALDDFMSCGAYDVLMQELFESDDKSTAFINGVIPENVKLSDELMQAVLEGKSQEELEKLVAQENKNA